MNDSTQQTMAVGRPVAADPPPERTDDVAALVKGGLGKDIHLMLVENPALGVGPSQTEFGGESTTLSDMPNFNIFQKLSQGRSIKIVAFGSSSTQRFMCGMHWFDYVELGFKNRNYNAGQFINSGVSGDSTVELLSRFDNECEAYHPDLVILTVGANDCRLGHSLDFFESNLGMLRDKIRNLGADLVLQTFYPIDSERAHTWWVGLDKYVDAVRKFAEQTATPLIDTAQRWQPLRDLHIDIYRTLLRDLGHLNERGNMLLGLDVMRFFNVELLMKDGQIEYCKEGLALQSAVDELNRKL